VAGLRSLADTSPLVSAIEALPGVHEVLVNAIAQRAVVVIDPGLIGVEEVVHEFEKRSIEVGRTLARWHLHVAGITCPTCVRYVEQAVQRVRGVHAATVNLATETLTIEYTPKRTDLDAVRAAVASQGYEIAPSRAPGPLASAGEPTAVQAADDRSRLQQFWVAAGIAVAALVLSHPETFGLSQLLPPGSFARRTVWGFLGLLTLPVLFYSAQSLYRGLWLSVKHRRVDWNVLIATAVTAAWLYSTLGVVVSSLPAAWRDATLFDVSVSIVALTLLGQIVEARLRRRSSEPIRQPEGPWGVNARVLRSGRELRIPVEEIQVGDLVLVRPGERIPTDGQIVEGTPAVDESAVLGPSAVGGKRPGDRVVEGGVSRGGEFVYRATRIGKDTTLSQVLRMVEDAAGSKSRTQRLLDVVSSYMTPAVAILAILAFMAWYTFGPDPTARYAVAVFIAVLVVASPRALGLAAPTPFLVAVAEGARGGILIRSGEVLEAANRVDTVAFATSGTLTEGKPAVTDVVAVAGDEAEVLRLAASLENLSAHPIGAAIVAHAEARGLVLADPAAFEAVPGLGVRGSVENCRVTVGNRRFMETHGCPPGDAAEVADRFAVDGKSPLFVAVDGKVVGVIAVADRVRADAASAVAALKKMGLDVVMLTGNDERTARTLARGAGIDRVVAEVGPSEKAERLASLRAGGGKVALVGEGLGDAPLLAKADVGIAVGALTDVAIEAADITVLNGELGAVARALELSRATVRALRQNAVGTLLFHLLALPIAAGALYPVLGVLLPPLVAAGLAAFAPALVVANANRLIAAA
jgi:Cu+-exporting ATPase